MRAAYCLLPLLYSLHRPARRLPCGELRVALTLAQGFGAKDAAELLGVGEPTVRTHLQRIFLKTRTSRQADMMRLLQASSPPIRIA